MQLLLYESVGWGLLQVMSAGASRTSLNLSGLAPAVRQNPNSMYPGLAVLDLVVMDEGLSVHHHLQHQQQQVSSSFDT